MNCECFRFGANPDLRDEDGKTPLDKAREGNNEGHREVANILQSPADWMGLANVDEEESLPPSGVSAIDDDPEATDSATKPVTSTPFAVTTAASAAAVEYSVKGDPEIVLRYVKSILPMFSRSYQSTMIQSVKKSSLGLIKKIVLYLSPALLGQVCQDDASLVGDIVEVLASVLDTEEDDEGHLACLLVIKDLMVKDKESGLFLEQFAKLGLYPKVHALSEGASDDELMTDKADTSMITSEPSAPKEDSKDITSEKAYSWRDWSIARGDNCFTMSVK